jgi:hypothetical protein
MRQSALDSAAEHALGASRANPVGRDSIACAPDEQAVEIVSRGPKQPVPVPRCRLPRRPASRASRSRAICARYGPCVS